jgi:chromosome segregation ATPase
MNDDRELKLGNIDNLDVEDEASEAPAGRRPAKQSPPPPAEKPGAAASRGAAPRGAAPASGSSVWMAATAFLLVLVVVLGVWFFRQLSHLQSVVDSRLSESTQQLGSLASQLSATDESVTQSSDQVRETLTLHDSEIRKLWDVSNKRNRGWIEKNQADIAQLNRQREELSKSIDAMKKELASLKAESQQLVQSRNQLQTRIELQAETVKQLDGKLAAHQKKTEALTTLLPAMQSLARLESAGGGVANRLTEIEAAIAAFDAYRRQVNVRLDRLEGGAR